MMASSSWHVMPLAVAILCGLLLRQAAAKCGVCNIRNGRTLDYALPATGDLGVCNNYKGNACCSPQTAALITAGELPVTVPGLPTLEVVNPDQCGKDPLAAPMSAACLNAFKSFDCFKECDVNAGKWRKFTTCDPNGAEIDNIPVNGGYCETWFQACKNDFLCMNATDTTPRPLIYDFLTNNVTCTVKDGGCNTVSNIFGNGADMCNRMFGSQLQYDIRNQAYDFSWDTSIIKGNPNDDELTEVGMPDACPDHAAGQVDNVTLSTTCGGDVIALPVQKQCQVCHVRNGQTRAVSSAIPDLPGACSKYKDGSCCSAETSQAIADNTFFSPQADFRWDRCYAKFPELKSAVVADPVTAAQYDRCERWFHQEHCLFECDANVGKFRKMNQCPAETQWWTLELSTIEQLPLKSTECDAWYNDCKAMRLCLCTSEDCALNKNNFFGLALSECTPSSCAKTLGDVFKGGKDMCSQLYGSSYYYGDIWGLAYSTAWNTDLVYNYTFQSNPNDKINTNVNFPVLCTKLVEQGIAQEICTDPLYDPRKDLTRIHASGSAALQASALMAVLLLLGAALQ